MERPPQFAGLSADEVRTLERARHGDEVDLKIASVPAGREIPARTLGELLGVGDQNIASNLRSLSLEGIRIVGRLNLQGISVACPVELTRCNLDRIDMPGARLVNLALIKCTIRDTVVATKLEVAGNVTIDGGSFGETVEPTTPTVDFDGAVIGGDLTLTGMSTHGALRLNNLTVGGKLRMSKGQVGAVSMREASVRDSADLDGIKFKSSVLMAGTSIAGGISFKSANFGGRLTIDNAQLGYLSIEECDFTGTLSVRGATVNGLCWLKQSQFRSEALASIDFGRAIVRGGMDLGPDLDAIGAVRLVAANVGGSFAFEGTVQPRYGAALDISDAAVGGDFTIRRGSKLGELRLRRTRIGGALNFEGSFRGADTVISSIDGRESELGELRSDALVTRGQINFRSSKIAGGVSFYRTMFEPPDKPGEWVLRMADASIEGSVIWGAPRTRVTSIELHGARVGWNVEIAGSVGRTEEPSVTLDHATIENVVIFGRSFKSKSPITLNGCTAKYLFLCGSVICGNRPLASDDGYLFATDFDQVEDADTTEPESAAVQFGQLDVPPPVVAIDLYEANIGYAVIHKLTTIGQIRVEGGAIGDLAIENSEIAPFRDEDSTEEELGVALSITRSVVSRKLSIANSNHFPRGILNLVECEIGDGHISGCFGNEQEINGRISLFATRIRRSLTLERFDLRGDVSLVDATVGETLSVIDTKETSDGARGSYQLDLRYAKIAALEIGETSGPPVTRLQGVDFQVIIPPPATSKSKTGSASESLGASKLRPVEVKERLTWLSKDPDGYSPGPYNCLASAYRRGGFEDAWREVSIESEKRRAEQRSIWHRLWSKLWNSIAGFGYRPAASIRWLMLFWLAGSAIIWLLQSKYRLPSTGNAAQGTESAMVGFKPALYLLDQLLPFMTTYQDKYVPTGIAVWVTPTLVVFGWVLFTGAAAGIAAALRRS